MLYNLLLMDSEMTGRPVMDQGSADKPGRGVLYGLVGMVIAVILLCNLEQAVSNLLGDILKGISAP
jgi:hypothetical protein